MATIQAWIASIRANGDRRKEKQGPERGVTPRSTRVSLVEAWQLGAGKVTPLNLVIHSMGQENFLSTVRRRCHQRWPRSAPS